MSLSFGEDFNERWKATSESFKQQIFSELASLCVLLDENDPHAKTAPADFSAPILNIDELTHWLNKQNCVWNEEDLQPLLDAANAKTQELLEPVHAHLQQFVLYLLTKN